MKHTEKTCLMYFNDVCTFATVHLYLPIPHQAQMR